MVGEFPELQGLMGRYYAEAGGIKPEIARAIELHYKPKGPTDTVPRVEEGDATAVAVALAWPGFMRAVPPIDGSRSAP